MAIQIQIQLPSFNQGFHLITKEIESQLGNLPKAGLLHLFINTLRRGSPSMENADPSVRHDLAKFTDKLIPERDPVYTLTFLKGMMICRPISKLLFYGSSVSIPIQHGKLALGTWQRVCYASSETVEGNRKLLATIIE